MPASIEIIWNTLVSFYSLLAGISERTSAQVRAYVRGFVGVFLGLIALMSTAIVLNNKTLSIITAILSSILVLVPFYLGRGGAKIADRLGSAENAKDLRALFSPLATLSLIFAFISTWVSIEGTESFKTPNFWVALTVAFFSFVFIIYTQSEKKYAGYVMAGIVAVILSQYIAPEAYRSSTRWVKSTATWGEAKLDRNSRNKQADSVVTFAKVIEESPVFDIETGKVADGVPVNEDGTPGMLAVGQDVMIVSVKKDYSEAGDEEPMEEIRLTDQFGNFRKLGKVFKFPRRKLGAYRVVSDYNKEIAPPQAPPQTASASAPASGRNLTITVQPGESPYKIDDVAAGQHIKYVSADGPFETRINKGDGRACWREINPNTHVILDWGGSLEAKTGNKTPVTFKINIS